MTHKRKKKKAPLERLRKLPHFWMPCPKCGAEAGQPCVSGAGHERKTMHHQRTSRRTNAGAHIRAAAACGGGT